MADAAFVRDLHRLFAKYIVAGDDSDGVASVIDA